MIKRNRAKCKLCSSIIESHFEGDVAVCACGAITVFGGESMDMAPFGSPNFMRVDDLGNEVLVQYRDIQADKQSEEDMNHHQEYTSYKEAVNELQRLIDADEHFVKNGDDSPIRRCDLLQYMNRIINIFNRLIE